MTQCTAWGSPSRRILRPQRPLYPQPGLSPTSTFVAQFADGLPLPQPIIQTVVDNNSQLPTAVVGGEIISIYGKNLGPSLPGISQIDTAGVALANVRVFFNSEFCCTQPAQLLYVAPNQIDAVVPTGLVSNNGSVNVQVQFMGGESAAFQVQVASSR